MGKNKKNTKKPIFWAFSLLFYSSDFFLTQNFLRRGLTPLESRLFGFLLKIGKGSFFFHNIFHNNFFTINHPLLAACQG